MHDDILLPIDGSENTEVVLEHAIREAKTHNAALHIFHVVDRSAVDLTADPIRNIDANMEAVYDQLEEGAQTLVEEKAEKARTKGVTTVTDIVEYGSPDEVIRKYTSEHEIDLIVMGTHGRSGLDHYLLGSVAEKTIRKSEVPILVVPLNGQ